MNQDTEHAQLHHQQQCEQQEYEEILKADPEHAKWLDNLEADRRREVADESSQAMHENKCFREDYE